MCIHFRSLIVFNETRCLFLKGTCPANVFVHVFEEVDIWEVVNMESALGCIIIEEWSKLVKNKTKPPKQTQNKTKKSSIIALRAPLITIPLLTVHPTLLSIPSYCVLHFIVHSTLYCSLTYCPFHYIRHLILLYTPLYCTFHLTFYPAVLSTPFWWSFCFTVHLTLLYTIPYCHQSYCSPTLHSAPSNCPPHLSGHLIY